MSLTRADWHVAARRPLPLAGYVVGALGVLCLVFGLVAGRPVATLVGALGLIIGLSAVVGAILLAVWPDAQTRTWLQQERAEKRVAARLEDLTTLGWLALHDRVLPGGDARVPHILVGPPGVVLVTPVPEFGPVWLDQWGHLFAGPQPLDGWLRVRKWEQDQLCDKIPHPHLSEQSWDGPVYAEGIVVTPRRAIRRRPLYPIPDAVLNVGLRHESRIGTIPMEFPGPLSREQVAALATTLDLVCPPAATADDA